MLASLKVPKGYFFKKRLFLSFTFFNDPTSWIDHATLRALLGEGQFIKIRNLTLFLVLDGHLGKR